MIVRNATAKDLVDYYGCEFSYQEFTGIVCIINGKIVAAAGICKTENVPSIAISDFDDDVGKKNRVIFGRLAMSVIIDNNELVWATCASDKDRHIVEKIGFEFVNYDGNIALMQWRPGYENY